MVEERKVPSGYKRTEVGVIPEEWGVKKLKNLTSMKSGNSITSKNINEFDIYPCFGGNGLRGYTSSYTHNGEFALIGRQGALCGNVQYVAGTFFASEHAVVVTANTETNIKWLSYMLIDMGLNQYSESSAQPGLSVSKILELKIAVPSEKTEQQAIAEALSDVDNLIASLEKLIDKKQKIKQGAMQELLTGKKRLPGFTGEWETNIIGKIINVKKGQLITEKDAIIGNIPVIAGGKKPAYYHNEPNRTGKTITISASGVSAGYVAFHNKPIFASDCSTISEVNEHLIEYVYYFLKLKQEVIYGMQTGGAQPHIHPKDIKPLEIKHPKLEEQQAIAQILTDMDSEIEALEEKLDKYKAIKQGMMQELLTGRIRLV